MDPVTEALNEAALAQALAKHHADMGDVKGAADWNKVLSQKLEDASLLADQGCSVFQDDELDFDIDVVVP